ncbi:DUF4279 domain-containing protein [Ensifer soli]|uniref:DUF4279 domain-containing protein n=1 Tax=Ciceribacter sp. sgz301302 TaxID=3342379 RepID=UPI0035B6BCF1
MEDLIGSASLFFFGDDLDPSQVTDVLGTTPSDSWKAGEIVVSKRGQQFGPKKTGMWTFRSSLNSGDVNELIDSIFSQAGLKYRRISEIKNLDSAFLLIHTFVDPGKSIEMDLGCDIIRKLAEENIGLHITVSSDDT